MVRLKLQRARDARALLALAHGAGAGMDQPFLTSLAKALAKQGITVARFEFPYMAARRGGARKPPDRMPVLEACFTEVAAALRTRDLPLFLAGKSMGGRVATQVADALGVRGVIAYGYPFHPPGKPQQLRTEHLAAIATPVLILQGTRDPFGTPAEVEGYALGASVRVHWLADGDHSLVPRKRSGRTAAQNLDEAAALSATFVRSLLSASE